ncbi:proton channel OtopLc [Bactrocera tryoni]|uniref:proton channel OtopLc n=1 Tax=Bactrocera tryoni TaxID=59916 RepID=UPI001A98A718|nr:proton channel OtopLc [Bactrocera tryoni]XP_039958305.1 proton channel OtopLc [Bactrocera tryoni]
MDSSPDLSLKLRRGSSDSRDNFYMDFAQGIDSDIEEVDNSALALEPQQPPPPPLPIVAPEDVLGAGFIPPPPLVMQGQPLPTLTEHDDLPPTPPPQEQPIGSVVDSPPASPTSSVLEMIPPPPLSPPMITPPPVRAVPLAPPSPPIETEDEGDDADVDEEEEDDDDKSTPPPPLPPLPSNFSYVHGNGAHGAGIPGAGVATPPKSPSTSPSPPDTPPPCPKMSLPMKLASPPPPPPPMHAPMPLPPLTPPSESDQSQPNSPPPLPQHAPLPQSPPHSTGSPASSVGSQPRSSGSQQRVVLVSPPLSTGSRPRSMGSPQGSINSPPHSISSQPRSIGTPPRSREAIPEDGPATPPPDFGEPSDVIAAALAAAIEVKSCELIQGITQGTAYHMIDENKSSNEDESTTITTPPSNGYSGSSLIVPPADQLGELEQDTGMMLADIPPPLGMEDEEPDDIQQEEMEIDEVSPKLPTEPMEVDEIVEEEEAYSERTPISDRQPSEDHTTADTPADEVVETRGTPTSQATPRSTPLPTPPASGSPKKKRSSVSISGGSGSGSRGPSRSASRSGSHSGSHGGSRNASRSGSVRGSIASRAGSIAAASVASAAASIASGSPHVVEAAASAAAVASPQTSIKSIRSQPSSIKSAHSKHSASPPMMKSPPEGDRPPVMPSPPMMRSPPLVKSPPLMHSPPKVTSPPRVYSPPLVGSPPTRKTDSVDLEKEAEAKPVKAPSVGTYSDSAAASSETLDAASIVSPTMAAAPPTVAAATASTSLSYQDEQQPPQHVMRAHLSSHHHYHLPHQFQHPHHQNHHTHGGVPVATPTVPASYAGAQHLLHHHHKTSPYSSSAMDEDSSGSVSGVSGPTPPAKPPHTQERRSPPSSGATATTMATSSVLLVADAAASSASVSPGRLASRSGSHHRVTIDESNIATSSALSHQLDVRGGDGGDDGDAGGSGGGGAGGSGPPSPGSSHRRLSSALGDDRQTGHLALMYHSHQLTSYPVLPAIKRTHRPSFIYPPMPRVRAGDALATLFSALYGKLLVVMGIAFPMAEVISTYIPPSFYEVYYLYLYIGSMIFLLFMYATLLWGRPKIPANITSPSKSTSKARSSTASESMDESDTDSNSMHNKRIPTVIPARRPSLLAPLGRQHHYGSFYLRMGAVAFGIGSMIYSGLEFGQYFELNPDTKCHNVLLALTPATRMAFIFIQMYFIFLNNEQIKVYRYKIIARFGLMHMIGTNLAVWLNVLIQETKHEILTFYNPENRTLRISHRIPGHSRGHANIPAVIPTDPTAHLRIPRGLKGPYQIFECRRTNILGTLVQDASPFLFPCTIEYSLICAAILYVMWRSISRPPTPAPQRPDTISSPMKRSPHHYSVDCARAHKGLFVGILILVLTIISLILFFVLISRPDFVALAVTEVTICELLIYGTATIATLIGMIQIRHLQYDWYRSFSLDDILLVGAQTGSFLYNIFTVIAGHFTLRSDDMLVPLNALASIVQTACQTLFILDASRRQAITPEHIRKKPGREIVTFMLVVNLAMWAISTLEKSRAESHPIQLNFYGLWAWTIITHVSMPLAIFYRFHSTVCLCEIWKRAYKLKPAYM